MYPIDVSGKKKRALTYTTRQQRRDGDANVKKNKNNNNNNKKPAFRLPGRARLRHCEKSATRRKYANPATANGARVYALRTYIRVMATVCVATLVTKTVIQFRAKV